MNKKINDNINNKDNIKRNEQEYTIHKSYNCLMWIFMKKTSELLWNERGNAAEKKHNNNNNNMK